MTGQVYSGNERLIRCQKINWCSSSYLLACYCALNNHNTQQLKLQLLVQSWACQLYRHSLMGFLFRIYQPYLSVQKTEAILTIKVASKMQLLAAVGFRGICLDDQSYEQVLSPLDTAQVPHSMITPRIKVSVSLNHAHVVVFLTSLCLVPGLG